MDTAPNPPASIVLVPGHWLGGWAWDSVAKILRARGHAVTAVTLPGYEPGRPGAAATTLTDQADALEQVVRDASAGGSSVVLVGHSGANYPISVVLDRDPSLVSRVVWVDSGPVSDASSFDPDPDLDPGPEPGSDSEPEPDPEPDLQATAGLVARPLPPFEALGEVASLEGLDAVALATFRERAIPVPGPVLSEQVRFTDDRRHAVPTTIIACSIPSAVMLQLAKDGHPMMAEVAHLTDLETVDLPTGHWPMWSRPDDLAEAISAAAGH